MDNRFNSRFLGNSQAEITTKSKYVRAGREAINRLLRVNTLLTALGSPDHINVEDNEKVITIDYLSVSLKFV